MARTNGLSWQYNFGTDGPRLAVAHTRTGPHVVCMVFGRTVEGVLDLVGIHVGTARSEREAVAVSKAVLGLASTNRGAPVGLRAADVRLAAGPILSEAFDELRKPDHRGWVYLHPADWSDADGVRGERRPVTAEMRVKLARMCVRYDEIRASGEEHARDVLRDELNLSEGGIKQRLRTAAQHGLWIAKPGRRGGYASPLAYELMEGTK